MQMSTLPIDQCMVWANNTGKIQCKRTDAWVKFGLKGSSDIIGCYKGLFLGIEVKTGRASQSSHQISFEKMIRQIGGIYVLIRDTNVNQLLSIVEQCYQETVGK